MLFSKGSPPYIFASMQRDHQDRSKTMSRTPINISDRIILACSVVKSHNFWHTFSNLKCAVVYQKSIFIYIFDKNKCSLSTRRRVRKNRSSQTQTKPKPKTIWSMKCFFSTGVLKSPKQYA